MGSVIHSKEIISSNRSYTGTPVTLAEAAPKPKPKWTKEEALFNKLAGRDYNNRRAAYNRQVKILRKEYAEEVARQKKADEEARQKREEEMTRKHLEHQRRKNIQSAQNALRQEEFRKQKEREFHEHLERQQKIRDEENERFRIARQFVIDELEKEAPFWLTTEEEVENAFTPETEQLLWTRAGGYIGVANPIPDAKFWGQETHTWHMTRIYPAMREVLLEDIQELAYKESNVESSFWTEERLRYHEKLEEKARLRAMVSSAGRAELLRKQRALIEGDVEESDVEIMSKVPSMTVFKRETVVENEGAKVLMEDPTKFFVFDMSEQERLASVNPENPSSSSPYKGPTLGAPIGLRDYLRENTPGGTVFPRFIGRYPKPDKRSEREKKQEEREEKMLLAAQAEAQQDANVDMAAEDQTVADLEPDLDYDTLQWDSDEEEWNRGLNPETDAHIINTPRDRRYSVDDIDWVLGKLKGKVNYLNEQFAADMGQLKQEAQAELRSKAAASGTPFSIPEGSLEEALLQLPEMELLALSDLDEIYTADMPAIEFEEHLKKMPGLTEEQVRTILNRDKNEKDS